MKRWRGLVEPVVTLLVCALALWLLHRQLAKVYWQEVVDNFALIPGWRVTAASVLTAFNYLILIGYDWLALAAIHRRLSWAKVSLASYTGFVCSYNFGSLLGGVSVRYRVYSGWGLSAMEVARMAVSLAVTFWIGLAALIGVVFVVWPLPLPTELHLPIDTTRPIGLGGLVVALAYLGPSVWNSLRRRTGEGAAAPAPATPSGRRRPWLAALWAPLRIWWREIAAPDYRIVLGQLLVAALDFVLAAGVLWVLMADDVTLSFPQFLSVYLLANVASVLMHVPGGLGVVETFVMDLASPASVPRGIAALFMFRVIYYLAPLLLAAVLLAANELALRRATVGGLWREAGRWWGRLAPRIISWGILAAGVVLLISAARPLDGARVSALADWLPLPVLEVAHFLAGLTGTGLLLLASGLHRRLASAFWLAVWLLAAGIGLSLANGLRYEEALLLGVLLVVLLTCRQRFFRPGSLLHEPWRPGWIAAVLLAVVCTGWLGVFLHRHVEYRSALWWTFALSGDAPRFLRAGMGVVAVLVLFAVRRLIEPHRPKPHPAEAAELEQAAAAIAQSPSTAANLALLGDKSFLFNSTRTAFVMYAVQGRSWVTMGDPVGPVAERAELVWDFREVCDEYDAWPVFYQVDSENRPIYRDQGLTLLQLGEEARVRLDRFDLEGADREALRHACQRLVPERCEFVLLPPEEVPGLLPELRRVSDAWLAEKRVSEKGFSLGSFREEYLRRFPCALVRRAGDILGFANLWCGAGRAELSVDLVRYRPDAPDGLMDFLLVELMRWGQARGYGWFNLGMAPLAGLEDDTLAPLGNHAAGLVFRHGDHFHSLQGLREYKDKFLPEWTPKYLAFPGRLSLPHILTDLALLIRQTGGAGGGETLPDTAAGGPAK
jgi:phosphatidylglycerol lysyltransferase